MVRLASSVWVSAYLRCLAGETIPAVVLHRGDSQSGAIWIKLNMLDGGAALYGAQYDMFADQHKWQLLAREGEPAIDEKIARERARDKDLWVIEVEDRLGRHLLDEGALVR